MKEHLKTINCLDKGFIRLVDYMGDDAAIVQAARVSYGEGTKTIEEDSGLIRYLMRMKHTSPFEQVEFKFHVKAPIFVFRQWQRHRAACLAEGSKIYFDLPGGIVRRGRQRYDIEISELYRKFHKNDFCKKRIKNMMLRQANEDNLRLQHTHITDVFKNGKKNVYRIILEDNRFIEATEDHLFFFSDGWSTIKEKCNLFLNKKNNPVVDCNDVYIYTNGMDLSIPKVYKNKDWLFEKYHTLGLRIPEIAEMAGVSYHTIRKWLKIYGLQKKYDYEKGHIPWNVGKTYKTNCCMSEERKQKIREARSGEKSNFWKGGVTPHRQSIGRWTTQIAHTIHKKNGFTCQLCHKNKVELHCHHIVPVWYDPSKGMDENNLTTLCVSCHKKINMNELDFVSILSGEPFVADKTKIVKRIAPNKLEIAKLVKIKKIEFVGEKETYDVEVEGPYHNFIANGFVTHNSLNETSLRYTEAKDECYVPDVNDLRFQSKNNKQCRDDKMIEKDVANNILLKIENFQKAAFEHYNGLIGTGLAREVARIDLPVTVYSEMYWKIDLHNLLHFLKLRTDKHAQLEIRVFAEAMYELIKPIVPVACKAFDDYILNSIILSKQEKEMFIELLKEESIREILLTKINESKISKREKSELKVKLELEE